MDEQAAFIKSVAENPKNSEAVRNAVFAVLDFAEAQPGPVPGEGRLTWGRAEGGSFKYSVWLGMKPTTLFICDAQGYVTVSVGNLINEFLPRPTDRRVRAIVGELAAIPGFKHLKAYTVRPGFSIGETLVREQVMARFQAAMLKLQSIVEM